MRQKEVSAKTGKPRSSIYADMEKGYFPKPVSIGKKAVAWRSTDIDDWIASRPYVHDLPINNVGSS